MMSPAISATIRIVLYAALLRGCAIIAPPLRHPVHSLPTEVP
jgi:hypothetical protein